MAVLFLLLFDGFSWLPRIEPPPVDRQIVKLFSLVFRSVWPFSLGLCLAISGKERKNGKTKMKTFS